MEMKIVIGIAPIILIIYLAIWDFFFFSSKISPSNILNVLPDHHHDQNHQSSSFSIYNKILIYAKPSYLFVFFTFNILLVAALLGISSQLSKSSATTMVSSHVEELSLSSLIDSYEGLKDGEDYYKDDRFIPATVCVHHGYDQEEEKALGGGVLESYNIDGFNFFFKNDEVYGYVDEEYYKKKDDFVPGIVHVEYKEEKVEVEGQISNFNDDYVVVGEKDLILMSEENKYGYDDDDDLEIYSEIDDIDLNKRIEEFIDENNKKWRQELQNDMLLQLY